jgi:cytochrome c biogenesis protein CcmG/thiol:disulfide interchange protein DsbE
MDRNDEKGVDRMIAERLSPLRANGDWQPDFERGLAILRERRAAMSGRRRRWAVVATGGVAACLLIMAFPVTRTFAGRCVSACVQDTAAVRGFLFGRASEPAPSSTFVKPGDRRMAPDFTLTDASGRNVKLSDFRGKVVLLNFWATWCAPCKHEIPWFIEFQRSNGHSGFAVLGVSMDEGGWAAVKPYIHEKGINFPVVIGNDEVAGQYGGLHAIPLTLIIDRSGRVAAVHSGLCTKQEYEADIAVIMNEK